MRNNFFKLRHKPILLFFTILLIALIIRLFMLTVLENPRWATASENVSTRSIYNTAPRGEIYDRYGRLLAGNVQSFSIRMSGVNQTDEQLNGNIDNVLKILETNGDKVVDDFPISIDRGKYNFTYEVESRDWLKRKGLSEKLTAEEAFNRFRIMLGIDPGLDRFAAQLEMQKKYNQYPPISVYEMKYTSEVEKEKFLQRYFGKDKKAAKMNAKEAFVEIRKKMKIDKTLSDGEARRIMVVRDSIKAMGFNQYIPAVIAKNVSNKTVMTVEEKGKHIVGVEAVTEPKRVYPHGALASHVIGYMGKLTTAEQEKYKDRGYESGAFIGKEGIEGKYETSLKGENGEKRVQVNARGQLQSTISEKAAKKGKDVYLTIDLELQKAAENGLEKTIVAMQNGSSSVSLESGTVPISKAAPSAKTGAVVAIEVETGNVLAMASYPDYDPGMFSEGISQENWQALQSTNLRDPLSPAPLYNLATKFATQPGSTFKPVTAVAGLESGLNPNERHVCGGKISMTDHTFACWIWNLRKGRHGALNMADALENSCNYYFYDVATGKDWYTGNSLKYNSKMDVDVIMKYVKGFGLGQSTGIEIEEVVVPMPSKERKIEGLKNSFGYALYAGAEEFFEEKITKNPKQLDKNISKMKEWMAQPQVSWNKLYNDMLPEMGIKSDKRTKVGELFLYSYYPQAKWNVADAMNIAIGQGENAYTPLQMANYIATLGNKGVRNKVSIIKSIEDLGSKEKVQGTKIELKNDKTLDHVIKGMKQVSTGQGSAVSGILGNLPFKVAAKTGTAERQGRINPPSEVAYIKENLRKIAPSMSWGKVEIEMKRLMKEFPNIYTNEDVAVRRAVINLSQGKLKSEDLDQYKGKYENFAWVIAMAPADNPKIAVCAMIPQGSTAANAAPVVREVLAKYFALEENYTVLEVKNIVQ